MVGDSEILRWDGWGRYDDPPLLSAASPFWTWIGHYLPAKALRDMPAAGRLRLSVPELNLPAGVIEALTNIVGSGNVVTAAPERARHAHGRGLHDLLILRNGTLRAVPDAVVYPSHEHEVMELLTFAERLHIAVVPFGGGTGAAGSPAAHENGRAGTIVIDLSRMNRVCSVDQAALTAVVQPGLRGPELERRLAEQGLTLGHCHRGYPHSTVGGWIAEGSAAPFAGVGGRVTDWLVAVKLATPRGMWRIECHAAPDTGPNLGALVIGSAGTLGVITEATIRVRPIGVRRLAGAFLARDFTAGLEAARRLSQSGLRLSFLRLADAEQMALEAAAMPPALAGGSAAARRKAGRLWRELLGYGKKSSLLMIGLEGQEATLRQNWRDVRHLLRGARVYTLGPAPAHHWLATRFQNMRLREDLLDRGVALETLETATRWSNVTHLRKQLRKALARGPTGRGLLHTAIGSVDSTLAHIVCTLIYPRRAENEIGQLRDIRKIASETILEHGGVLTRATAAGVADASWIVEEKGPLGCAALTAAKCALDPAGILNPRALLPEHITARPVHAPPDAEAMLSERAEIALPFRRKARLRKSA